MIKQKCNCRQCILNRALSIIFLLFQHTLSQSKWQVTAQTFVKVENCSKNTTTYSCFYVRLIVFGIKKERSVVFKCSAGASSYGEKKIIRCKIDLTSAFKYACIQLLSCPKYQKKSLDGTPYSFECVLQKCNVICLLSIWS